MTADQPAVDPVARRTYLAVLALTIVVAIGAISTVVVDGPRWLSVSLGIASFAVGSALSKLKARAEGAA